MYQVKYGGKKGKTVKLVESPDLVVVRTKNNVELNQAKLSREGQAVISDSTKVVDFPEAGVSVLRINTENVEDHAQLESTGRRSNLAPPAARIQKRDSARATLKKEEEIRFAGRVLTDEKTGEVVLYTENFFVKFKDKVSESRCVELLEKYQLRIKDTLVFAKNSYFVQAAEGTGLKVFEISEQLLNEPETEYCHPELVQERRFKSIHPMQWHLTTTEIRGKKINAGVNIEAAWQYTKGKDITIAIVDDGVDLSHPEFAGRIVHPRDVTRNSDDANPVLPDDNHGTACAGVACAAGLPNGASGVAPEAFLMPIRLRSGLGSMAEANAFVWAAQKGADVISCSWGPTDGNWWDPHHALHRHVTPLPDSTRLAMEFALKKGRNGKGCVILFAAGNGNESTNNDGYTSYPEVICVAACNDTGKRSVYSDYGSSVWVAFPSGDYSYRPFKHPAPISDGIRTTDRMAAKGYSPEDYVNSFNGTSSACPGMAGVVALMLAVNPDLTPQQVKELIKISTHKIDPENGEYDANGHSIYYGYGRIDAGLAVKNALAQRKKATTIDGSVRFSGRKPIRIQTETWMGNFPKPKKMLGFSLELKPKLPDLQLKYKANVAGQKFLENEFEGEYIGAPNGRSSVLGFSIWLTGAQATDFDVEYAARLQGVAEPVVGKNGSFCGSQKKEGSPVEGLLISIRRR